MQRFVDGPLKTVDEVVRAIERHLAHMANYPMWCIGVAADPDKRYEELSEPPFWAHWLVESESIALAVKDYFQKKGMRPDESKQANARFVYIY